MPRAACCVLRVLEQAHRPRPPVHVAGVGAVQHLKDVVAGGANAGHAAVTVLDGGGSIVFPDLLQLVGPSSACAYSDAAGRAA